MKFHTLGAIGCAAGMLVPLPGCHASHDVGADSALPDAFRAHDAGAAIDAEHDAGRDAAGGDAREDAGASDDASPPPDARPWPEHDAGPLPPERNTLFTLAVVYSGGARNRLELFESDVESGLVVQRSLVPGGEDATRSTGSYDTLRLFVARDGRVHVVEDLSTHPVAAHTLHPSGEWTSTPMPDGLGSLVVPWGDDWIYVVPTTDAARLVRFRAGIREETFVAEIRTPSLVVLGADDVVYIGERQSTGLRVHAVDPGSLLWLGSVDLRVEGADGGLAVDVDHSIVTIDEVRAALLTRFSARGEHVDFDSVPAGGDSVRGIRRDGTILVGGAGGISAYDASLASDWIGMPDLPSGMAAAGWAWADPASR